MRAEKNDLSKPTHLPSKSDLVTALSLTLSSLIGVACVLGERSTFSHKKRRGFVKLPDSTFLDCSTFLLNSLFLPTPLVINPSV